MPLTRVVLLLALAGSLAAQVVPGRFIVELADAPLGLLARSRTRSSDFQSRAARIASAQRTAGRRVQDRGGRVLGTLNTVMNAIVVDTGGEAPWLAAVPGVVRVYPVEVLTYNLDHALPLHNVPAAWTAVGGAGKAGAGMKIAILDSGISPEHPGFQDASLNVPEGYPKASSDENLGYTNAKIIVARDYHTFYPNVQTDDVRDRNGHGTAVAMCAAGAANQAPWGFITGVAPKAWIGAYKISPNESGSSSSDAIVKAMDDAVADGMDVINLSSGASLVRPVEESPLTVAIERASAAGVIVVVSAGNDGPTLGTISNAASSPSAISVGASENDRSLSPGVEAPGFRPMLALPRNGPIPDGPVAGLLKDIVSIDPASTACSPLPEESLKGTVALAVATGCTFETKFRNMESAGAVAAVLYIPNAGTSPIGMAAGEVRLPAVMVGFDDGRTLRTLATDAPGTVAKVWMGGLAFSSEPHRLRTASSRGPTYNYRIKPDLAATGYVYTAAQKLNDKGGEYNAAGYIVTAGTSFSSPIVAGAAAVLKAARPGLTVAQYRSLLINRAAILDTPGSGIVRIQRTGNGVLDLASSLGGTVAASPTSLSFGIGGGTVEKSAALQVSNLGTAAETYTFGISRFDSAPPPQFAEKQDGEYTGENFTVTVAAGESKTIYARWKAESLEAGEYQGMISIQGKGDGAFALVPYWYGVPSNTPSVVKQIQAPAAGVTAGGFTDAYFRISDEVGIAITDPDVLKYEGTVVSGGGSMIPAQTSAVYPGLVYVRLISGATAGRNTYRVSFAGLPPVNLTVEGRAP